MSVTLGCTSEQAATLSCASQANSDYLPRYQAEMQRGHLFLYLCLCFTSKIQFPTVLKLNLCPTIA